MTEEHRIMNEIRIALSEIGCIVFRINVGKGRTFDGRYFDTGVPVGFSDLFGVRADGKAFFIEVKTPKGKPSQAQMNFLQAMKHNGALAGICRSAEEALILIRSEDKNV
ncbi:MAG: VRR-NUC domain-containing protein [Acutalibacteraceae bacterium]|nr:VRR-NUC domain-containing protein [Acutalibacteraceae bacterium]